MKQQVAESNERDLRRFFCRSVRNLGDQACGFLSGYWCRLKIAIEQQEHTFRLAHEGLQSAMEEDEEAFLTLTHYASNYAKGLLFELTVLEKVFEEHFPQQFQKLVAECRRDDSQ